MPPPKTYLRLEGTEVTLPQEYERRELAAQPREMYPGGAAVSDRRTAARWHRSQLVHVVRRDEPFLLLSGEPCLQPLRKTPHLKCVDPALDPRGSARAGLEPSLIAGLCVDVWYDR